MKAISTRTTDWFGWISKNNRWIIAVLLLITAFAVISGSAVRFNNMPSKAQSVNTAPVRPVYGDIHLIPAAY